MPRLRVEVVALLLLSTGLVLCGLNWHAIVTATDEMGDAAANSLLVQDAKVLALLVGNYSRVGFNHPGPALLYVLAFGEWAFHDVLHVVRSPFAGQLVAVALYDAGWIVTGFCLLRRLAGSSSDAALTGAIFLLAAVCENPETLPSAWFPHLYILPFAVSLVAFASLACGRVDAVVALAVCVGMLINGHVAFIPIVGCLAIATLAFNAVAAFARLPDVRPLKRRLARDERGRLLAAVALVLASLVPLALQTQLHPPGPLVDYLRFGESHGPNEASDAVTFLGLFWSEAAECAALLITYTVMRSGFVPDPWATRWKAVVWLLLAATVTVFLYAVFGIDLLNQTYIVYFYGAVPAWTIAFGALRLWRCLPGALQSVATWPVASALVATTLVVSQSREGDLTPAKTSMIAAFDAAAQRLGDGRPVIFDFDPRSAYGAMWPFLAGVAVHAKRQQRQPFCIDHGWHVSFTQALRCDADTRSHARRYLLRTVEDGAARAPPLFAYAGVAVFDESGSDDQRARPNSSPSSTER